MPARFQCVFRRGCAGAGCVGSISAGLRPDGVAGIVGRHRSRCDLARWRKRGGQSGHPGSQDTFTALHFDQGWQPTGSSRNARENRRPGLLTRQRSALCRHPKNPSFQKNNPGSTSRLDTVVRPEIPSTASSALHAAKYCLGAQRRVPCTRMQKRDPHATQPGLPQRPPVPATGRKSHAFRGQSDSLDRRSTRSARDDRFRRHTRREIPADTRTGFGRGKPARHTLAERTRTTHRPHDQRRTHHLGTGGTQNRCATGTGAGTGGGTGSGCGCQIGA